MRAGDWAGGQEQTEGPLLRGNCRHLSGSSSRGPTYRHTWQRFEELGFFFAGILPRPTKLDEPEGVNSSDLLRLQYLNGPRIDYDRLQIYGDFGKELVQYIRERDILA